MKLFKHARVFAPNDLGQKDVLVSGNKIIAIDAQINLQSSHGLQVIDATGHYLVPGFIDSLVHISGGGGEGGFKTRTPQMPFSDAVEAGVTTMVGVLGTDSITRSIEDMLARAKALKEFGLSVYCHTGSYHYPAPTITGAIEKDIMLIDEFIGLGEIAISDHRGSQLSWQELAKVASKARVGGMLSGKSGIVSVHVGDSSSGLDLLFEVAKNSDVPLSQFYPTHVNRNSDLLTQGFEFAKAGGVIDFTTSTTDQILAEGEVAADDAVRQALADGVDPMHITLSSDGNASLPCFDKQGRLIDLQIGRVSSLHKSLVSCVHKQEIDLGTALMTVTQSPANVLGLDNKGQISPGFDADIVLLDEMDLAIKQVYAMGECLMGEGGLIKATYFAEA